MSIAYCLATYRASNFEAWYTAWKPLFDKHKVTLYVSWDSHFEPPWTHEVVFIQRGQFGMEVPTHSSACRSEAVFAAYQAGHEFIGFLDDDVFPPKDGSDPIEAYIEGFKLNVKGTGYYDVSGQFYEEGFYSRGFPYKERHITPVVAQYGGWDNTPDFDARDSNVFAEEFGCEISDYQFQFQRKIEVVPKYMGFTGCFMNCMFRREVAVCLYHLYQGVDRTGYDRFDDIWASLILKRICDEKGWSILINGEATCEHARLSDIKKSLMQEQAGHEINENLWDKLQRMDLSGTTTFPEGYELLVSVLPSNQSLQAKKWVERFQ